MNIRLCTMTQELCREYYRKFSYDPDIFMDMSRFGTYVYSAEHADAHWKRQKERKRVHLAIMLDDSIVGELVLKHIDRDAKSCTLGIHLVNDSVKNKGYGTEAERLALRYAFCDLGMETVLADAILKNTRSQHVLSKVGFIEIGQDEEFRYYQCEKATWMADNT